MLSLLLDARDEAGEPMTDVEIRDQLLTMLVAGHETTATALAWAFERLLRHPAVLARLRAELERGESRYLDAAIKESLRLRPVVPIAARKLIGPVEVGGRQYEPGTVLMPCIFLLHRNPTSTRRRRSSGPSASSTSSRRPTRGFRSAAAFAAASARASRCWRCASWSSPCCAALDLRPATRRDERIVRRAFTLSPKRGARVVATRVRTPA